MRLRIAEQIGIIGLKIAILTSLLVLVVASFVGYWVYDAAIDEMIEHERVDLRDETSLRGHELLATIAELRTDILSLATDPSINGIFRARLEAPNEMDELVDPNSGKTDHQLRQELADAFQRLCLNERATSENSSVGEVGDRAIVKPYFQVRLIEIGEKGRELVRVERIDGEAEAVFRPVDVSILDTDERYIKGQREYIVAAQDLGPHEVYLGEINLNREFDTDTGTDQIELERPTLRAAVCVRDDSNTAVGVLVINLDLAELFDAYLKSARHLAILTDQQGRFLVHPDQRMEFSWEKTPSESLLIDYPDRSGDFTIRTEKLLYPELEEFYGPGHGRTHSSSSINGYNLAGSDSDDEGVLDLEYPFQLNRIRLSSDWNEAAWPRLTQTLATHRTEYRALIDANRLMLPRPDRLVAGSTRVLSISAPLNDDEALSALSQIEADLTGIPGVELQYAEPCSRFYASFVRLSYDPQDPQRFLGLVMAFSRDEMYADLRETRNLAIIRGIVFVVLATLVAFVFSYMLTRRLNLVTNASESIANGDFGVALPTESRDEIGDLARGFQHMIHEVQGREQKIEEREVRLRMIVDGAAEGIITIDPDGRIRSANTAALRMFGLDGQSVSGGHTRDLLADCAWDEFQFTLKRLLVEGASSGEMPVLDEDASTFRQLLRNREAKTESLSLESTGRRLKGEEFPIELSLSTVRLPDQRVVTLITRDITQRKQDEKQIQQLNEELERRNENLEQGVRERTAELESAMHELRAARDKAQELAKAKDAFLASVSHELRNPLNQVSGFCQLLELSELDDGQHQDVRKIRVANDQLLALINDILDYQKIIMGGLRLEPQDLEVESLLGEVRDAMSVLPNPNENQLYVEWSDDVGKLYADKQRIRQTLLNLVGNAWKFTRGGSVHLSAVRRHGDSGEWIDFSVQDTGRGMTPEEQDKLFRPFTKLASRQGNESGTGLGLVITKGLCTLMRGDIRLESEFGRGSRFSIRIPATVDDMIPDLETMSSLPETIARTIDESSKPTELVTATAEAAEFVVSESSQVMDRGRLVLVIDDDPAVRELMERHLSSHGFKVATAGNGFEGLELARKLNPAVITLDAVMPGLDGWAVLGALKAGEETNAIPVIMVTVMDKEERGQALGATEFLPKPIDWERLTKTLARYTGNKSERSILVVDDDANTREIVRRSLEGDGWSVIEAENGKEALERLAEERPAAVLLDLMMPIMDGFEFIVNYSQVAEWLSIPVLVMTAMDPTPEERARLEGQVVRVLRKGDYTHDELLTEIHRRVDRHLKGQLTSTGDEDGEDSGR